MTQLTIFYDGTCPLCLKEMKALKQHDTQDLLSIVDLHSPDFAAYPHVDPVEASRILHAYDHNHNLLLGLDVTYRAWSLVGKGWLYAPLRWPLISPMADWAYIKFANNRYTVSKWLTGKSKCDSGQCSR
ncbi:DUF393 domain-containing protein [Vibrio sp. MarTm2]|uniref:thiol-disulfide oxidoreductase DCC family protein n=1 Tax=Vibrio sp. MarTm2 TaxID=2998831 RepID=UPI0022CD259A|nr:DUF393 domain-containing protein [Vibrio sp. MarTm2]MDA0128032.1 DUF393 domain-containing protein [Vibrio sp. MarTm2]